MRIDVIPRIQKHHKMLPCPYKAQILGTVDRRLSGLISRRISHDGLLHLHSRLSGKHVVRPIKQTVLAVSLRAFFSAQDLRIGPGGSTVPRQS